MAGEETHGRGSNGRRARSWWLLAAVATSVCPAARAKAPLLEEIVVTAQRIPRPAQLAPISLSAFSGEALRRRQVVTAREIAAITPNLTWLATDGSSVGNVFVRGVGSPSIHSNQLGAVGIYVDDVTLNAPVLSAFDMVDIDRVEIVRGPWNAAPGRNASGGALRFVTRAPEVGAEPEADIYVSVGTESRLDGELAAGFPLGRQAAARLVVARESLGDYIDNPNLDRQEGGHERTTVRARWRLETDARTAVDVDLHGSQFHGDPIRYKQIGVGTSDDPGATDCPELVGDFDPGNGCVDQTGFRDTRAFDENHSGNPHRFSVQTRGASLRLQDQAGRLVVLSLTAFEGGKSRRAEDTDGGPSFIFASYQDTDSRQLSQDLELGWEVERAAMHAGVHLLGEDARYTSVRRFPNWFFTPVLQPGIPIAEEGVLTSMTYGALEQRSRHASLWGSASVPLADRSTLTAEMRIAYERLAGQIRSGFWSDLVPELTPTQFIDTSDVLGFATRSVQVRGGSLPELCPLPFATTRCYKLTPFDRTDTLWGGRLTLDRRFSDIALAYATVARGFKGAGISPIAFEALQGVDGRPVRPETVVTYELGVKSEWREQTLRVNSSVFLNDWSDYQLYLDVTTGTGVVALFTNLPEVRTWGGELEIDWVPTESWRVSAGLGVAKGEIREVGNVLNAHVGDRLTDVPELTFNGVVSRNWRIGSGRLTLQADARYNGETPHEDGGDRLLVEPAYWLVDASAAYRFQDDRYELSLWGRNLGASTYCVRRQDLRGVPAGNVIGCQPNEGLRYFGLSIRARVD